MSMFCMRENFGLAASVARPSARRRRRANNYGPGRRRWSEGGPTAPAARAAYGSLSNCPTRQSERRRRCPIRLFALRSGCAGALLLLALTCYCCQRARRRWFDKRSVTTGLAARRTSESHLRARFVWPRELDGGFLSTELRARAASR